MLDITRGRTERIKSSYQASLLRTKLVLVVVGLFRAVHHFRKESLVPLVRIYTMKNVVDIVGGPPVAIRRKLKVVIDTKCAKGDSISACPI